MKLSTNQSRFCISGAAYLVTAVCLVVLTGLYFHTSEIPEVFGKYSKPYFSPLMILTFLLPFPGGITKFMFLE